jgi:subtilisin family serine protease
MVEMRKFLFLLFICIEVLFFDSNTYSGSIIRRDIEWQPTMAAQLNYPPLPADVQERIVGTRPNVRPKPAQANLLMESWGLFHIGLFDVFTPTMQPIDKSLSPCYQGIVVAVIDTGIDYTHPDLKDNLWINKGETGYWQPGNSSAMCNDRSCNGLDDDGNGFIDDVIGWDFVHDIPLPYDTHGHGTNIAGIIASSAANGIGTTGVCPTASIMSLKFYDSSGIGYSNLQNTVRAIQYAVRMGANIINYSGGGADLALNERLAVEDAEKHGILFVAAAGNDGRNNDFRPYYPASYGFDNEIAVASITKTDELLSNSNFGHTVDVGAPGMSILSTLPGKWGTMSGTSQATAFVSGAAALIASQYSSTGNFDYKKVRSLILNGTRPLKGNQDYKILSSGLLYIPGSFKIIQSEKKLKKQK